jgi:uncharacterized protein (UPF0335 family)
MKLKIKKENKTIKKSKLKQLIREVYQELNEERNSRIISNESKEIYKNISGILWFSNNNIINGEAFKIVFNKKFNH